MTNQSIAMNPDELTCISETTHQATVEGTRLLLRAYLDEQGNERIIWRIDDTLGNDARLDPKKSDVILPQGRSVTIDGRTYQRYPIPRWLTKALTNEFEKFDVTTVRDSSEESTQTDDDCEEIEPIFDDMPVAGEDDEDSHEN